MEQFGFTGLIFMKSYILVFVENLSRNFKLDLNLTIIAGTLREVVIVSGWILLRMRNISDKI